MKYALIEDGLATVISRDPKRADDEAWALVPEGVFAGHRLVDSEWVAPEPPPPPVTAAQVIAERDRRMEIVVGQYSETEQKTWPMQIEEARAVLVDPEDPALMIRPMAEARGQSVADFAAYIVQLNNAYRAATGAVFAASRRLMDTDPIPNDYKDNKHWP